jgi:hypothetical protein
MAIYVISIFGKRDGDTIARIRVSRTVIPTK